MMEMITSSPGLSTERPSVRATRFKASLAFLVKTTWLPQGLPVSSTAPRKAATLSRVCAMASVASTERR